MKATLLKRLVGGTSEQRRAAFTLTELLAIIAIVAVLFSLALPGLAGAGGRSRVAQCGSNLKQYTMVLELYAMDNNNNLLRNSVSANNWPWDFEASSFTNLIKYGATRDMVYCPANPGQNNDVLWFYGGGFVHITGYAMTFPGTPGLLSSNINSSLIPKAIPFGPLLMPPPPSSKRVLVADAVISAHGQADPSMVSKYRFFRQSRGRRNLEWPAISSPDQPSPRPIAERRQPWNVGWARRMAQIQRHDFADGSTGCRDNSYLLVVIRPFN